ncbi:MAG: helix-turn-helix transcriptional regulator [Bacteroidetes bacterium]|nr:helix-turn-helix transcriptional regulator [Bacteroidota bacterium]
MKTSLLATKFHIPRVRPNAVERLNLIKRLDAGLDNKLTIISAPTGFGKSTLLSEWIQNLQVCDTTSEPVVEMSLTHIAWFSIDENDNDFVRFISYLLGSLELSGVFDGSSDDDLKAAMDIMGTTQQPLPAIILTPLLNRLSELNRKIILILDDYHYIENIAIHGLMSFMVNNMPQSMHLLIATRHDPPLPLARLRAQNELTEVRAEDLRFSSIETTEFISRTIGLDLSEEDTSILEKRTEGWAAGLQLAAVSLQGVGDIPAAIASFAGSHRHITDYLLDEVLNRQSSDIQEFLLKTSVLELLTGSLCDSVMLSSRGQETIEALEKANLFIVPLDKERKWYRYHHLFADLLRQRLRQTYSESIPELHLRASEWFEKEDRPSDAIRHAITAKNFSRAADLAELVWPEWNESSSSIIWLGWVRALPEELVRTRPVLSAAFAWAFLNSGELEKADSLLTCAERWMESKDPTDKMVVIDHKQFEGLLPWLAILRAYYAQAAGDVKGTVKHVSRVLEILPEEDHYTRTSMKGLLGLAKWADGDLETAFRLFSENLFQNEHDRIKGAFVLADIGMTLGKLDEAVRICEQALQLAADYKEPYPPGTEDVYSAISALHREQGNLSAAVRDLDRAWELGRQVKLPDWKYRWCIAKARLQESQGNPEYSLALLDDAGQAYVRTPLPVIRPISAMKARVWIRLGRLSEALHWADEQHLSCSDSLSFLHEFEHITFVRLLIAGDMNQIQVPVNEVIEFIDRLLKSAEEGRRVGSVIEILILQSIAFQKLGYQDQAVKVLQCALELAEPEGFFQIFIDEGSLMAGLLYKESILGMKSGYVQRLLEAFPAADTDRVCSFPVQDGQVNLFEALSRREIEVLELIEDGFSNEEVGERLYISLHTVKAHTRTIYTKLDVHSRTEAVARARTFGILK